MHISSGNSTLPSPTRLRSKTGFQLETDIYYFDKHDILRGYMAIGRSPMKWTDAFKVDHDYQFSCAHCDMWFGTASGLVFHLREDHKVKRRGVGTCVYCGKQHRCSRTEADKLHKRREVSWKLGMHLLECKEYKVLHAHYALLGEHATPPK